MENNPVQSADKIENESISAAERIQQLNLMIQNESHMGNVPQIEAQSQKRQAQIQESQQNASNQLSKIDPMPIQQNEIINREQGVNIHQNDILADPQNVNLDLNIQSLTQNKDELLETLYQPQPCNPDNNPALQAQNIEASFKNRQNKEKQIQDNRISAQNIQNVIDDHDNFIQYEKTEELGEDYFQEDNLHEVEEEQGYQPSLTEVSHKLQEEQLIQQWRDQEVHINSQSLSGGFQFKNNTDYQFIGLEENSSKVKSELKDSKAKTVEESNFKIKPAELTKSATQNIQSSPTQVIAPAKIIQTKVQAKQKERSLQNEIENAFIIKKKQQPKKETRSLKDQLRKFQLHEQQKKRKEKQSKSVIEEKAVSPPKVKLQEPKKQQLQKTEETIKKQQMIIPIAEIKKKQQTKKQLDPKPQLQNKKEELKKKQQKPPKQQQNKKTVEIIKHQQPKKIQKVQAQIIPKKQEKKVQRTKNQIHSHTDKSETKSTVIKDNKVDQQIKQKDIPKANNRLALTARDKPQNNSQQAQKVQQEKIAQQPIIKPLKKKKKKTNKPKVENSQIKQPQKVNLEQTRASEQQSRLNVDPHHRYSEAPNRGNSDQNNADNNNDRPLRHSLQVQPDNRNAASAIVQSTSQLRGPLMTSLIIVKQAEKERVGTTYKMFLKYSFQYQKTLQTYKNILGNVSNELNNQKSLKKYLQGNMQDYFQDFCKVNKQFNDKCYKLQIQSQLLSPSTNKFANIRLQLKKGFDQMIYLRKSIANQYNRISNYINNTVLQNIKKVFEHYYFSIGQEEIKQNVRRQQHYRREKIFKKVQSKLDKHFNKGLQGKLKEDLFIQITKYINQEKNHRSSLRTFGRGILDIRRTYIKCEKELFDKLQDILNKFKFESKMIYSFEPKVFNDIVDVTMEIKSKTKFAQLCTLTDLDYIKYVLEVHTKRENNDFTSRHFEDYLNLDFFDRVVGNIRDMLKGATNKIFPMRNERQQLIHSISGNLILFDRENDGCKDKYCIKNINAKIISEGFVEFDQLLKGVIFDDSRTIRLRMVDSDRAQQLICYLNQKQDDFEV